MLSKIENGKLTYQHKHDEGSYYLWNYSYLDGDYDFTIETSIKHVSQLFSSFVSASYSTDHLATNERFCVRHASRIDAPMRTDGANALVVVAHLW